MTMLTLLTNAAETSTPFDWPGGVGVFTATGSMERGMVALQYLGPDGITWLDEGSRTRLLAPGHGLFELPAVKIRAFVSKRLTNGMAPSGISATAGTLNAAEGSATPDVDREVAFVSYRVKTAFTGASVGDTITSLRVIDVTGESPVQVSLTWFNDSTAAALASAPNAANLEPLATGGLTNAQFVAGVAGLATQTTLAAVLTRANLLATEATLAKIARETYSSVKPVSATTSASAGATPTAFGNQACTSLDIVNDSTVTIEYLRAGESIYIPIQAGGARLVQGITNANQISIRRKDQSTTSITFSAEAFTV